MSVINVICQEDQPAAELIAGQQHYPAWIGKKGSICADKKREGDRKTPLAILHPLALLYREDRVNRPQTQLPVNSLRRWDGWCDDPHSPSYNQPVHLPFGASAERLWRADRLYDLLIILDWNMNPVKKNKGSAIFMHLVEEDKKGTQGCIALQKKDLLELLKNMHVKTAISAHS